MRSACIFSLLILAGCATGLRPPREVPDADQRELSIADDLGADPDLAPAKIDLAGSDLAGSDLAMTGGCGVAQVVVNEVQTGGVTASDEWVELYNPCSSTVDLAGCKLAYRAATNSTANDTYVLAPLNLTIAGGGYLLIANSGYAGAATPDLKPFAAGGLSDIGGAVGLRDGAGKLVDSMGWGSASNPFVETAAANNGAHSQSMARTPNGADSNNNGADFAVATPTPRAAN